MSRAQDHEDARERARRRLSERVEASETAPARRTSPGIPRLARADEARETGAFSAVSQTQQVQALEVAATTRSGMHSVEALRAAATTRSGVHSVEALRAAATTRSGVHSVEALRAGQEVGATQVTSGVFEVAAVSEPRLARHRLVALLCTSLGEEKATELVLEAAVALDLGTMDFNQDEAVALLGQLSTRAGLIGIAASLARSRVARLFRDAIAAGDVV